MLANLGTILAAILRASFLLTIGLHLEVAYAQSTHSLELGNTDLSPGMSKEKVEEALLASDNQVIKGDPDVWVVMSGEEALGNVVFKGEKLALVTRVWTRANRSATDFVQALYGALQSVSEGHANSACVATYKIRQDPTSNLYDITLVFGRRRIHIYTGEMAEIQLLGLEEELSLE